VFLHLTTESSSHVLVFHRGELRESGNHQALLNLRGLYWRLFQLQYAEKSLPVSSLQMAQNRQLNTESIWYFAASDTIFPFLHPLLPKPAKP
jgi:hypothetical protein